MSANNDTCNLGQLHWQMVSNAAYMAYEILPPIHLGLGLPGQIFCLLALYRQSKKEKAYAYQIFYSISDIVSLIAQFAWIYSMYHWSGYSYIKPGASWFVNSYPLMWFEAHLAAQAMHMCFTNALLSSLIMSIDRVLAMAIPFRYRNFKHRRNQYLAFAVSILISISSSVFDCYSFKLETVSGQYKVSLDSDFSNGRLAYWFNQLRNIIRTVGVIALVTCNVLMVYFYKKKRKIVTQALPNQQKQESKRKSQEKTLFLITLSQSFLTTVAVFGKVAQMYFLFSMPTFVPCGYNALMGPVVDAMRQIANMSEFYLVLIISSQFRQAVKGALSCAKADVTTISVGTAGTAQ